MATCIDCKQDMKTSTGCTIDELNLDGVTYARKPFGYEPSWPTKASRCGDCGCERGEHHHLGCDAARCPKCEWQLFSCGCPFEEYRVSELEMLTGALV